MRNSITLPEKYYLQHFYEFLAFIQKTSGYLIGDEVRIWIQDVDLLSEDARCLLVRLLNRNVQAVHEKTLAYEEIPVLSDALEELDKMGFINEINQDNWKNALTYTTKDELIACGRSLNLDIKSSLKKQTIADQLIELASVGDVLEAGLFEKYWYKNRTEHFEYLLFLYFGHLESRLNKFSLRDLGVTNTLSTNLELRSEGRFSSLEEAELCFKYSLLLDQLKRIKLINLISLKEAVLAVSKPISQRSELLYNKLIVKVARLIERENEQSALELYRLSDSPEAEERYLRLEYKLGSKSLVKERLEQILNDAASESLLLFAEDFLDRKFGNKKTSRLTDVLRAATSVSVDEMFRHNVEQGVANVFREQGNVALETENWFWRALFGLTFWEELFESPLSVCSEFDAIPQCLREGRFYELHKEAIEHRLALLASREHYIQYVNDVLRKNRGTSNGLVVWSGSLAQRLTSVLEKIELVPLQKMLISMAKSFRDWSDGFPDLAVIDSEKVRFKEVKSPGDSLRRNQLVVLNRLREVGFEADVVRVDWVVNPNQPYTVVDIETTGGTKDHHRITEIGAVKLVAGEVVGRWQTLINPERHIPSFITGLTGITDQMVEGAPLFSDIANEFRQFLTGSIFVAHNANFDYGFIKSEYLRLGESFSMPKMCTVKEMKRFFPGCESYGLSKLCVAFDINLNQHHRALSDAEATSELLKMINHKRFNTD